jgi:hypothetical protein
VCVCVGGLMDGFRQMTMSQIANLDSFKSEVPKLGGWVKGWSKAGWVGVRAEELGWGGGGGWGVVRYLAMSNSRSRTHAHPRPRPIVKYWSNAGQILVKRWSNAGKFSPRPIDPDPQPLRQVNPRVIWRLRILFFAFKNLL